MTVRVLFFAQYRDLAGREELQLELPDGGTVRIALELLRSTAGLAALPDRISVAVNRTVVHGDAALSEGDELALLPPVAGG